MQKLLIFTGIYKFTAAKTLRSGDYKLNFLPLPWIRSRLRDGVATILELDLHWRDLMEQAFLDPEVPIDMPESQIALENVGVGIQGWVVSIDDGLIEIRENAELLWDQHCWFPPSANSNDFKSLEWGWRFIKPTRHIEVRPCCFSGETPQYKSLEFLAPKVKPHISYTWPSKYSSDSEGMKNFEDLLMSRLKRQRNFSRTLTLKS